MIVCSPPGDSCRLHANYHRDSSAANHRTVLLPLERT
jgi:hypothetical protein